MIVSKKQLVVFGGFHESTRYVTTVYVWLLHHSTDRRHVTFCVTSKFTWKCRFHCHTSIVIKYRTLEIFKCSTCTSKVHYFSKFTQPWQCIRICWLKMNAAKCKKLCAKFWLQWITCFPNSNVCINSDVWSPPLPLQGFCLLQWCLLLLPGHLLLVPPRSIRLWTLPTLSLSDDRHAWWHGCHYLWRIL